MQPLHDRNALMACLVIGGIALLAWYQSLHAQCSGSKATFAAATHVEIHPDPLPGYIVACYDLAGNLLTASSVQVPGPGLVMVNFAAPQTGNCVVK